MDCEYNLNKSIKMANRSLFMPHFFKDWSFIILAFACINCKTLTRPWRNFEVAKNGALSELHIEPPKHCMCQGACHGFQSTQPCFG